MTDNKRYVKFSVYLVAVILVNLAGATLFLRADLTGNKVYSLSDVSRDVVSSLKEPLTINVFFTGSLPAPYNTVEQYLKDLLAEYALYSNTYFNYRFYDVSAEGEIDAARTETNRKLAQNYGIPPVQIQVVEKDEMKFKKAYMGLVIVHGDMVERIPTITSTDGLEYKLTTSIQRLNSKISALLSLKDKVKVTLYVSPSLKSISSHMGIKDLDALQPEVKKLVDELNTRMYGRLDYTFSEPENEAEMTELSRKHNLMMLKWPAMEGGTPSGAGVVGLLVEYAGRSSMIPVIQAFNVPLFGTQYQLTEMQQFKESMEQSVEALIGINESLGYLADRGTIDLFSRPGSTASVNNFSSIASRSYSLKDVSLKQGIPEGLASLLIVRPTEPFSDYDLYVIDQALMRGTNLAIFYDPFVEAASPQGSPYPQQAGQMVPVNTGLDKLLEHYGISVKPSIVLDENCFKQRLPEQYGGGEQQVYFAPIIESSRINNSLAYLKDIKEFVTYKCAPLALVDQRIKAGSLKATLLFSSSEKSWEMKGQITLNPMFIRPPEGGEGMGSRPLAYLIEGSFPSYFTGKPIPEKPAGDQGSNSGEAKPASGDVPKPSAGSLETKGVFLEKSKPARIFVIGSSEMLSDSLISEQGDNTNAMLVMNIIDVLNNRQDTAAMRSKVQTFNPLAVKDERVRIAAKIFNIAGLPIFVVACGLLVLLRRHGRKKRIEAAFKG